ncbi:MAG TPA: calcium-binding protein, partial [Candidatus Obscuribacterales bacterium]
VGYGGSDTATVVNQAASSNAIERFELDNGSYLTAADVNSIIQQMAAYAADHSASFTSLNDVQTNQDLMAIIASSWRPA